MEGLPRHPQHRGAPAALRGACHRGAPGGAAEQPGDVRAVPPGVRRGRTAAAEAGGPRGGAQAGRGSASRQGSGQAAGGRVARGRQVARVREDGEAAEGGRDAAEDAAQPAYSRPLGYEKGGEEAAAEGEVRDGRF
ncbi:hypothetical protein PG985_009402 [Apiospora marii]|uniref:uncharacterized protein n=1 Tax=Apiospora marii TaxID=335849 RepID=UPI003130E7A3